MAVKKRNVIMDVKIGMKTCPSQTRALRAGHKVRFSRPYKRQ